MAQLLNTQSLINKLRFRATAYGQRFNRALVEAGHVLHEWSGVYVPIDTGNLWSTSYVRSQGVGFASIITVAYTAPYAVIVHEDVTVRHGHKWNVYYVSKINAGMEHSRRGGEQAKFLEKPVRDPLVLKEMRDVINGIMNA